MTDSYSQVRDPLTGGLLATIRRDADGAIIPADPANADFQAAQAWLAAGHALSPAAAWAPPPPTLTFLQFMALFSPAEQGAVVGSADIKVKLFVVMASGSGGLQLGNAEVVEGINYLVSAGLITSDRAAAILAGAPPPTA